MTYYIIVKTGDDACTYGIFTTEQLAQEKIKRLYANGMFGELIICEEELESK